MHQSNLTYHYAFALVMFKVMMMFKLLRTKCMNASLHFNRLCLSVYRSASFLPGFRQSDDCGDDPNRAGLSHFLLENDRKTNPYFPNHQYNAKSVMFP